MMRHSFYLRSFSRMRLYGENHECFVADSALRQAGGVLKDLHRSREIKFDHPETMLM